MTIADHTCITVACDVCKYAYDEDESYTVHFDTVDQARTILHPEGWLITADRKVFCASGDIEHQAAIAALMPTEPTTEIPGQLALDGTET